MHNKQRFLKFIAAFVFHLCLINKGFAHSPDISSILIYEQNGRHYLEIKSSLTAFEGEIDYHYKKNAYKTPEEFQQLVATYFRKKCLLVINDETIQFVKPIVVLGHATTVFVELFDVPQSVHTLYLKNELFADMPNNQSELILTLNGYPQKQFVLMNENNHTLKLMTENGNWKVVAAQHSFLKPSTLILLLILFLVVLVGFILAVRNIKKSKKSKKAVEVQG